MPSDSTRARGLLNPTAAAEAFYRPLAVDETRRAVARYRDAKRRHEEACALADELFEAIGNPSAPGDRLDAFKNAIGRELLDATAALIRLCVAWDCEALDNNTDCAERQMWPPRGVIVNGTVYLAIPADRDDADSMKPGERSRDGRWIMRLVEMPASSLVNLDDAPEELAAAAQRSAPRAKGKSGRRK